MKKALAALLSLLTVLSAASGLCLSVLADEVTTAASALETTTAETATNETPAVTDTAPATPAETTPGTTTETTPGATTETTPGGETGETGTEEKAIDYLKDAFRTPEDKYATMTVKRVSDTHELAVEEKTGEVACRDIRTGQILFTNPFDVASTGTTDDIRAQLLSQIIIKYTDNGNEKTYNSYTDCAVSDQITVKDTKNGVRVEYKIGREETTYLCPKLIEKTRFETMILENLPEGRKRIEVESRYILYDPSDTTQPESVLANMQYLYPITKEGMAVYAFISDAVARDYTVVENYIKEFCSDYSYEELEYDHNMTGYSGTDVAPALFKLALEYELNETGMEVRLSANGIRFDETNYRLSEIQVLPYIGAGCVSGYTFIPDGSGAITRFEEFQGVGINTAGTIYGQDYAYHTVSGTSQEVMRFPVYGVVENAEMKIVTEVTEEKEVVDEEGNPVLDDDGNPVKQTVVTGTTSVKKPVSRGFLAIIEEGDALVSIMATSGTTTHKYFSVLSRFNPRQSDEYRLSDSISGASSSALTVESKRKYVDNFSLRFVMLSDATLAEENNVKDFYEPTWLGMAKAYRDYLEDNGSLTRLTAADTESGIPLYIQTLGVIETTDKVLSIPVTVTKPLTSFEDVIAMYDELSAEGIKNVNFKLTGYANGGLYYTAYNKVEWEDAAGGKKGFTKLVDYAKANNFGVYPDFDLAYVWDDVTGDGFTPKEHAIKTIDNRYTTKYVYNAAIQTYEAGAYCALSPSVYSFFFEKLEKDYAKYSPIGISLSTMGTDLNSDFDEDDPYNREDSKLFIQELLSKAKESVSKVMIDGGNAYTLAYADHIVDVSLDSSRYSLTSNAVPFTGAVLHGYVNIAGTAINLSGDTDYELLKAIENGAGLNFILAMQNTNLLKQTWSTSQYYSVMYTTWKTELMRMYKVLDEALSPVQTERIVDHEFIKGYRIADEDEIAANIAAAEQKILDDAEAVKALEREAKIAKMRELYEAGTLPAGLSIDEYILAVEEAGDNTEEAPAEETPAEDTTIADAVRESYLSDDGNIVKVTYENGTYFILNYNDFDVTVDDDGTERTIYSYGFFDSAHPNTDYGNDNAEGEGK